MPTPPDPGGEPGPPSISIPEIRDYQRINAELVTLLDQGHRTILLDGAEGQRLLASGLSGSWQAVVIVRGRTGPEFASSLNAPGLLIVGRGSTADGAGRGLRVGSVVIVGDAADAAGYDQSGGLLIVTGSVGHRAGLAQSGGTMAVLGSTGRLTSDRQVGGSFLVKGRVGSYPGKGRQGGRLIESVSEANLGADDSAAWLDILAMASRWLDDAQPSPA